MGFLKRVAFNFPFGLRLILFFLFPVIYYPDFELSFPIFAALFVITWILDFSLGRTFWITTRIFTYICQLLYWLIVAWVVSISWVAPWYVFWFTPLLIFAFNSDAITNATRWKVLLPATTFSWLLYIIVLPKLSPLPAGTLFGVPNAFYIYGLLPGIATLARLFFPRTKHLIHTSLDYPLFRLELLSFGMKRLAAVGVKKA